MDLTVANQGGGGNNPMLRDYRKGNWTLQETMVLIEAKKMDDERRMKTSQGQDRGKPAELRWKWVEDYCWKNGCLRSQNQCNDKWDNLMRDFKKVREYERRVLSMADENAGVERSYWRIEKNERKDNNLPSNMLPQIYEALVEVVERKGQRAAVAAGGGGAGSSSAVLPVGVENTMPPQMRQYPVIQAPAAAAAVAPPVQAPAEIPSGGVPSSQPLPAVDSDTSEYSDSPAKRRKRRGGGGGEGSGGGGGGGGGGSRIEEIGTAISKSGRMIAEAIQTCEEREERRHREILSVHERRLQIEQSKAEINRQGINGLVDAINNLANSIHALASHNNNQSTSK